MTASVVVEKPFGRDLATAKALNATLAQHFDEGQISASRIDFINTFWQRNRAEGTPGCGSVWQRCLNRVGNNHYVDHIQITVAETVGVAGAGPITIRCHARYGKNHLMQLLRLIAMEAPSVLMLTLCGRKAESHSRIVIN
jgi:glucose-6-phosphate 1-dehydrogenase